MPFRDIPTHRRIVELLQRSVSRGTLPPSLLFGGAATATARQTALALAQALNCTNLQNADACGSCAACTRIARGVHPDVVAVDPQDSGAIKIDQIREVVDRAAYRPFEGRRRVVIVNDADALVPAAQNALLKTLEEPPPSSVFVLVTARPDALLATVRSRCIRLFFAEDASPEIDEEAREVAHRVLMQAAAAGANSARRLEGAKELLVKTGGGGATDRQIVSRHLAAMATLLRDVQALAVRAGDAVVANADIVPAIERLVSAYRGDRGVAAFAAVDRALEALDRNAGVKVVADWLVLQL